MILNKVSEARNVIEKKAPKNVMVWIRTQAVLLEAKRVQWAIDIRLKKETEEQQLKAIDQYYNERMKEKENADPDNYVKQEYVDSSGGNILKKPMAYALIILYTAVLFILGTALVFYGLGVLVIFFVLRSLWRKIKK